MVYRDGKKIDSPEEDDGSKSNLISKSMLPEGTKVGDEVRLKVVHLFDDEAEVQYAHSDENELEDESQKAPTEDMEVLTADA